ncbi:hypothetical protein [Pseudomonas sp. EMN2]|uniref:hypothetical protein n=1 Tax=Pseudomonas sp. EMN2 TaxID=2615212 RepID=UPI001C498E61|nr:hypothetical protein [Pseudomonas sp. EMN2]
MQQAATATTLECICCSATFVDSLNLKYTRCEGCRREVSETILKQLGGARFLAMTGAKHLMFCDGNLRFKLSNNFAKDGINFVDIQLTKADLYEVKYSKITHSRTKGPQELIIARDSMVYGDMLRSTFTAATGLYTSL